MIIQTALDYKKNLCFFIPLYNEIKYIQVIEENINKITEIFPEARIYISDNKSDDGTWDELINLKSKYPLALFLYQQQRNFGFSYNLCSIAKVMYGERDEQIVCILGANDIITIDGLKHIRNIMLEQNDVDFIMSNWSMYRTGENGNEVFWTGDVNKQFKCIDLESFFNFHNYIQVGIMQFTARLKILKKMISYQNSDSPQMGAFIDSFPCSFVAAGNPPLALIKYTEDKGWRSNACSIYKTHFNVINEICELIKQKYDKHIITEITFEKISYIYKSNLIKLLYSLYKENWGKWTGGGIYSIFHVMRFISLLYFCFKSSSPLRSKLIYMLLKENSNAYFRCPKMQNFYKNNPYFMKLFYNRHIISPLRSYFQSPNIN